MGIIFTMKIVEPLEYTLNKQFTMILWYFAFIIESLPTVFL